ncbi:P-loop containing nucleoside triphosphate hydrolase protein [Clavulina sp. PMI_390]|nr:P-loop containing nucleoside triphosphate hydrolase protein [Clavulina sp. PMI_390]
MSAPHYKPLSMAGKALPDSPRYRLSETRMGIWRVLTEHPIKPSWIDSLPRQVLDLWQSLPVVRKFALECYDLAPYQLLLWFFMRIVNSLSGAISLYISSLLLDLVEGVIENRNPNPHRLLVIGTLRVLFSFMQWASHEILDATERTLKERIGRHMAAYKVRVYSRLDVPTRADAAVRSKLEHLSSDNVGWNTLSGVVNSFSKVLTIVSQITMLLAVFMHETGGRDFFILALIQPVVLFLSSKDEGPLPRDGVYAVFQANPDYRRMTTIKNIITGPTYRDEMVGSGLRDYFLNAYNEADKKLGDVPISDPWQSRPSSSYWRSALPWLTYDLPWILFAFYAYTSNGSVPLKALMLLEQSISSLTYHLQDFFRDGKTIAEWLQNLHQVYEAISIENKVVDGATPYPLPSPPIEKTDSDEGNGDVGMEIEFKDVSFTYPEYDYPALSHMSFKIEPGQLCVIVGENGSGKSSTTKLLQRLFDATEGEVLIDGRNVKDYVIQDVRRSTAVLYQDYQAFPLTLGENIAIGAPEVDVTLDDIQKAAELGQASGFIDRLPNRYQTNIDVDYPYSDTLFKAAPDSLLRAQVAEMESETKLSGGEWQRLAIARTFMRVMRDEEGETKKKRRNDNQLRLMCFDEPSSAQDPKAEFELFERLRAMKGKRTLIFITHRFGHLTKYADLILFMKNGSIVEQGSHQDLLAADGEYASLYNLQAKAFAPPSTSGDTDPEGDDWSVSEEGWQQSQPQTNPH